MLLIQSYLFSVYTHLYIFIYILCFLINFDIKPYVIKDMVFKESNIC